MVLVSDGSVQNNFNYRYSFSTAQYFVFQGNEIDQANCYASMQQNELRPNPGAISQNTSEFAQWSTHRIKQCYSAALPQDKDHGNQHSLTQNKPSSQSWNPQKLHQSTSVFYHQLRSPQSNLNFSSSVSQLKLQVILLVIQKFILEIVVLQSLHSGH